MNRSFEYSQSSLCWIYCLYNSDNSLKGCMLLNFYAEVLTLKSPKKTNRSFWKLFLSLSFLAQATILHAVKQPYPCWVSGEAEKAQCVGLAALWNSWLWAHPVHSPPRDSVPQPFPCCVCMQVPQRERQGRAESTWGLKGKIRVES